MTRPTYNPLLVTVAYYASFVIFGFAAAAMGPSLPTLTAHTASSLDRISLIFVTDALGYVLSCLVAGQIYDRLPGNRVLTVSLVVMAGAAVVFPLASALGVLLIAAFVMGIGKGSVDVGCNALLQWVHGPASGPYLNGLHFGFGLGAFFAPILLARVLSATRDIYWVFWTIAILIIPLATWLWFLWEPPAPRRANIRGESRVPFVPVLLIAVALFLYVGAEIGFSSWLYTYAVTLRLASAVGAAYLTSAFWALFTAGRLLGVWVATRVRSQTILYVDFAGALLSVGLIGLAGSSSLLLWVGSVMYGLSLASIFPTILLLAGERLQVSGTITGWFFFGSGLGGMLLPWLIGNAFVWSGPRAMIGLVFADLVLNAVVLLFFISGTRTGARAAPAVPEP